MENEKNLETIDCLYPHIFILYENKMCIKQFLELCIHTVTRLDMELLETEALNSWALAIKVEHHISPSDSQSVS